MKFSASILLIEQVYKLRTSFLETRSKGSHRSKSADDLKMQKLIWVSYYTFSTFRNLGNLLEQNYSETETHSRIPFRIPNSKFDEELVS